MGVKPSAVVIAVVVFLLIVTFISNATSIVVAIGCCLVPAYFTVMVMETEEWDSMKKYLIYWIIYAILEVLAPLFMLVLSSTLYVLLRVGVTAAIIHPESSMGLKLYDGFIAPLMEGRDRQTENDISNVMKKGKNYIEKGKEFIRKDVNEDW